MDDSKRRGGQSRVVKTNKDFVRFDYRINQAESGEDLDANNPLFRAASNLVESGKPYLGHSIALFSMGKKGLFKYQTVRWLGVFLLSKGNRVIFFPGFNQKSEWISTTSKGNTTQAADFSTDHLSLEADRKSWHFTEAGSTIHKAGGKTLNVNKNRVLWFGFSIKNENVLKVVKRSTLLGYSSPATDSERRIELFSRIQNEAAQHIITPSNKGLNRFDPSFLHFTVCIGPKGAEDYEGPEWLLPTGSPRLEDPIPKTIKDFYIARHRIALANQIDIQISCMLLPGNISVPSIYSTWNRK